MVAVKREVGEGASHGCSQEHQRHGFGKVGAPSLPPSILIVTEEGNGAKEGTGAALGAKECKALSSTEGGEGVRKEWGFQEGQAQGEELVASLLQVRVGGGGGRGMEGGRGRGRAEGGEGRGVSPTGAGTAATAATATPPPPPLLYLPHYLLYPRLIHPSNLPPCLPSSSSSSSSLLPSTSRGQLQQKLGPSNQHGRGGVVAYP